MVVILFRSRLRPEAGEDYESMTAVMDAAARTMPGFIDVRSYTSADGERLTVVWWRDEQSLRAWREHAHHQVAQKTGREKWYEYYRMEVATIDRTSDFSRGLAPSGDVEHAVVPDLAKGR